MEIDREREFLRHVVRIELERAFRGPQRTVVVAQIREREAQVVMRAGVLRIRLDGPHERVARVGKAFQLHQHQADAVPRGRGCRLAGEDLTIRLERELEAAQMGQEQREVEPRADELRRELERLPKRFDRILGAALVREDHPDVVPRERVAGIHLRRLTVRDHGVRRPPRLMQHDTPLVPELRRIGDFVDERLVELERVREVALEEVHLRHRLAHQPPILAALDREAIFAERFGVIALLPEREPEVVMRQLAAFHHFRRGLLAQPVLGRLALGAVPLQRQVGLRACERRVQLNRALGGGARVLMTTHVAQHERHQIMGVGVVRIERDRALQRGQRGLVQAAIVVDLPQVEVHDARIGLLLRGVLEPLGRDLQPASRLLGETELDNRRHVFRLVGEQRFEFGDRFLESAQNRVRAA